MENIDSWFAEQDKVKEFIDELKDDVKKERSFTRTMYVYNSNLRKDIHDFAQRNGLCHISYRDESKEAEYKSKYWCSYCERWLRSDAYSEMSDEREKLVTCGYCEEIIADEEGQYDSDCDKEPKSYYTNNVIAVSNDIELLNDIFKAKKIKKPKKWLEKQEAKFTCKPTKEEILAFKVEQFKKKLGVLC